MNLSIFDFSDTLSQNLFGLSNSAVPSCSPTFSGNSTTSSSKVLNQQNLLDFTNNDAARALLAGCYPTSPTSDEQCHSKTYFSPSSQLDALELSVDESDASETDHENTEYEPTQEEVMLRSCPTATEEERICGNCWANETPLWRRNDDGCFLCNACGLFLRTYKKNRPFKVGRVSVHKKKNSVVPKMACNNCSTTETTLWRRGAGKAPLCNACGLYWKIHAVDRPLKPNRKIRVCRRLRVWKSANDKLNAKLYSTKNPSNDAPAASVKTTGNDNYAGVSTSLPISNLATSTDPSTPSTPSSMPLPEFKPLSFSSMSSHFVGASSLPTSTPYPGISSLPFFQPTISLATPSVDPSFLSQPLMFSPPAYGSAPAMPVGFPATNANNLLVSTAMGLKLSPTELFHQYSIDDDKISMVQKVMESLNFQAQALNLCTQQQDVLNQQPYMNMVNTLV